MFSALAGVLLVTGGYRFGAVCLTVLLSPARWAGVLAAAGIVLSARQDIN